MTIETMRDLVTEASGGKPQCDQLTMTCVDGGRRELFRWTIADRVVEVEVPALTPKTEIARLLVEEARQP